jgi:hypothetical protein
MKLGGKTICPPTPRTITIPRGDDVYTFKVGPVAFSDFDEIYPEPTPPTVTKAGGAKFYNMKDPKFVESKEKRNQARVDFIVIKSLAYTEDIEWDTVDLDNIETWNNWKDEMLGSGLTEPEIGRIFSEILKVNSLTEDTIDDAEKGFLPIKDQVELKIDQVEEPDSI